MCVILEPRKIQCKCGSQNIVKPVNESNWIWKCLDCGNTKQKVEPVTISGQSWTRTKEDISKPIKF